LIYQAGLPILTALDLLIKRQRDKITAAAAGKWSASGSRAASCCRDAFAAQQVFPKMYTTTLLAGEKSGNMEEVLSRYITYQRMVQTFPQEASGISGVSGVLITTRDGSWFF